MSNHGPTANSFISQRLRMHYVDWGNPGAPPLILQHGGRDHCRSWDWVAEELAKDWHVIAPDLRGHGDSAWAPDGNYEMNMFVYDFAQLVHSLGHDQVSIVAHSLGGNVATRFAGSASWSTSKGSAPRPKFAPNAKPRAMPTAFANGSKTSARPRPASRAAMKRSKRPLRG
jgi:alpha-beta hydrolase superfamily lysophospholipase